MKSNPNPNTNRNLETAQLVVPGQKNHLGVCALSTSGEEEK